MLTLNKVGVTFNAMERSDLFWRNVRKNKWENSTFRILKTFISSKNSYIDMGSWIGPTVLVGAQFARYCFAVEPDAVAYKELQQNVTLNPAFEKKITIYQGCIWIKSGFVSFGSQTSFGDSSSSIIFAECKNSVNVPALTFDDYVKQYHIHDCSFIKMDIEGGEADVLPSMKEYLTRFKPVIFLSLHQKWFKTREQSIDNIINVLKEYQYLYTGQGQRVSLNDLKEIMLRQEVAEVVVTDKAWPWFSRITNRLLCHWGL